MGVGPSTLLLPRIPSVELPTIVPPGGLISETTAHAVTNPKDREEDKASVSNFYRSHVPHMSNWIVRHQRSKSAHSREYRLLQKAANDRLVEWARRWMGLGSPPTLYCALDGERCDTIWRNGTPDEPDTIQPRLRSFRQSVRS